MLDLIKKKTEKNKTQSVTIKNEPVITEKKEEQAPNVSEECSHEVNPEKKYVQMKKKTIRSLLYNLQYERYLITLLQDIDFQKFFMNTQHREFKDKQKLILNNNQKLVNIMMKIKTIDQANKDNKIHIQQNKQNKKKQYDIPVELAEYTEQLELKPEEKYSQAQISGLLKKYVKKQNIYVSRDDMSEEEKLNHPTKKIFIADQLLTNVFKLSENEKRMDLG